MKTKTADLQERLGRSLDKIAVDIPEGFKSLGFKKRRVIFYWDGCGATPIPEKARHVAFPDFLEGRNHVVYGEPLFLDKDYRRV